MSDIIRTEKAPEAIGPYSQAVRVGDFVFTSGQIPLTPAGAQDAETVADQAKQCIDNVEAILNEAGLTLAHVVKTTIFLTDMADFATVNEVYDQAFQEPYPARSTVAVAALPKGAKVEIEVVAHA